MNHIRRANGIATRSKPNFGQSWTQLISSWPLFVCYRAAIPSRLQVTEGRVIGAQTVQKLMRDSGWRRNWAGGGTSETNSKLHRVEQHVVRQSVSLFLFATIPFSFSLDMRVTVYIYRYFLLEIFKLFFFLLYVTELTNLAKKNWINYSYHWPAMRATY